MIATKSTEPSTKSAQATTHTNLVNARLASSRHRDRPNGSDDVRSRASTAAGSPHSYSATAVTAPTTSHDHGAAPCANCRDTEHDTTTKSGHAGSLRDRQPGYGVTGGVSGLTMSVTSKTPGCACADGLEAIQVFWGTPRTDGVVVGKKSVTRHGKTWHTFVDGGLNSPGGAVYNGFPFYMGRSDLPATYGYNAAQGSAGSTSGCDITVTDTPGAVRIHDEAYFETAIMCLGAGSGLDTVLDVFKWGFTAKGTKYKTSPGTGGKASGLETYSATSADFEATLKSDYPSYSHS